MTALNLGFYVPAGADYESATRLEATFQLTLASLTEVQGEQLYATLKGKISVWAFAIASVYLGSQLPTSQSPSSAVYITLNPSPDRFVAQPFEVNDAASRFSTRNAIWTGAFLGVLLCWHMSK